MSDPLVTPEELATYLQQDLDRASAELALELAQGLCEAVVSPLPTAAKSVVLTAAGRAYANPAGAAYQTAGPFSMQSPNPGLYLTRDERRSLKLMAGRGGAFTVDPTPTEGVEPGITWPLTSQGHIFDPSNPGWSSWP